MFRISIGDCSPDVLFHSLICLRYELYNVSLGMGMKALTSTGFFLTSGVFTTFQRACKPSWIIVLACHVSVRVRSSHRPLPPAAWQSRASPSTADRLSWSRSMSATIDAVSRACHIIWPKRGSRAEKAAKYHHGNPMHHPTILRTFSSPAAMSATGVQVSRLRS